MHSGGQFPHTHTHTHTYIALNQCVHLTGLEEEFCLAGVEIVAFCFSFDR
uniref:Uncharacterized protein n=1 Tax=Anguilla anguilla TaxID=7936 RepID=A0A0E9W7P1_ANGAN